jgi:hypothetical protein
MATATHPQPTTAGGPTMKLPALFLTILIGFSAFAAWANAP